MKKIIMPLFLVVLLFVYQGERVYADATATAQLVDYSIKMAPTLAKFGPEMALVGCAIVACGIVYQNREQIVSTTGMIVNQMKAAGIPFLRDATTGAINMTTQARDFIVSKVASLQSTGVYTSSGTVGVRTNCEWDITLHNSSTGESMATNLYYPVDSNWFYTIMDYGNGNLMHVIVTDGVANIIASANSWDKIDWRDTIIPDGITNNTQSVCAPLPSTMFPNGAIDIPTATAQIPVGSISVPLNPSVGGVASTWDTAIDSNIGASTWDTALDNVGAVPYTGDVTVEPPATSTMPTDWSVPSTGSLNFTPLMVASDKFPFCIPFDMVNLFRPFSADRVAPVFHVTFPAMMGVQSASFDYDFSKLNKLATILRYFILVIFSYGLVVKTRGLIKG